MTGKGTGKKTEAWYGAGGPNAGREREGKTNATVQDSVRLSPQDRRLPTRMGAIQPAFVGPRPRMTPGFWSYSHLGVSDTIWKVRVAARNLSLFGKREN